jgi:hypothetical protein
MNLFKKHVVRRVGAVGVGVGLLVLGLEAPAFAAAPVVSSFTPTSGPAAGGCVVVVTGTSLDDFPTFSDVTFDPQPSGTSIDATDYLIISDTEVWVVAPALTAGTDYTITLTNSGGTSTSTGTFLATTNAGGCAPTLDSFTPTCGSANDQVVFTGTNLLQDLTGAQNIGGGDISFLNTAGDYTTIADVVPPDSDTATTLTRFVPSDVADGPVGVDTGVGSMVFSEAKFLTPPPDCVTTGPTHGRAITLSLKKHLVAKGMVSLTDATDTTTDCIAGVPVKIQKRKSGHWKTVGSTTTKDNGAYKKRIKDKPGRYRAKAPKVTLTTGDVCSGAKSRTVKHK